MFYKRVSCYVNVSIERLSDATFVSVCTPPAGCGNPAGSSATTKPNSTWTRPTTSFVRRWWSLTWRVCAGFFGTITRWESAPHGTSLNAAYTGQSESRRNDGMVPPMNHFNNNLYAAVVCVIVIYTEHFYFSMYVARCHEGCVPNHLPQNPILIPVLIKTICWLRCTPKDVLSPHTHLIVFMTLPVPMMMFFDCSVLIETFDPWY